MRKLHSFGMHERPQAAILHEMLEKEGIACLLRNEALFAAMGEIPLPECFPELWVIDEEVYPRAKLLLQGWLTTEERQDPWGCTRCGERLEGQFGACWKCGEERSA